MNRPSTARFYADLSTHRLSLSRLLDDRKLFEEVPADWHVVVTDIKNSTRAFQEGRHEEVNLIATGGIIAVLNLARKAGIEIPFFFGGDGATFIVPPVLQSSSLRALGVHRSNIRDAFDLELRVGSVAVADLAAATHRMQIARLVVTERYSIPILLGDGLSEAERIVKTNDPDIEIAPGDQAVLDLEGMECRWDRVRPEVSSHEVVCLVVTAEKEHAQAPVFKQVVDVIDEIYGSPELRNPISTRRLQLTGRKLALEMKARTGRSNIWYLVRNWVITQYGKLFYLDSEAGRDYVESLVTLTDTLVIDGRINTVIAGSTEQRSRLEKRLEALENEGLIQFGLFVSRESVMSCYVSDRKEKHIHFVDGSDGGYTMAAAMWKRKRQL